MENSTKINMPTLKADDIIEKAAVIRVQELDTLINNMADSLSKASSGKNLSKYWKTQDELIKDVITSYKIFNKESNKDNATELIKATNALKAIAGVDLSNILPNFDEFTKSFNNAKKKVGNLDSAFNVKGFKEVFNVFETLEQQGLDVQEVFSRLGAGSNVSKLQNNIRSLEDEVEKLTKRLIIADDARDALKNEFDNFKTGSGISNMMEDLDEANAKLEKLRNEAVETFENFLKITNVAQKRTDQWGMSEYDFDDYRFQDYFQRIKDGSMTAQEAIADFKLQYDYLLKDSSTNNDTFGLDQLQAFSAKLDSIFQQVEETSNKINDILSNGVIAKSVQNLSEDTALSDSQRSIFGNILQDEESLKSITALFQKLIDETNQAKNTEVFNTEQFTKLESLFTSIESSLSSIKGVLVDVGDGEELSPLLKTIANIESAIDNLSSSVKGIGLNMNIDFGSDTELEAKAEAKISNALQAYQNLFEHIKMSSAGGSLITQKFFDFDINQFDTPMSKLQAYIKFIKDMREETKKMFGGQDILKIDTDDKYWNRASAAMGQVKKTFNEMKATNDTNPLENIFGKTDLSGVIEQLNTIVSKLDEISVSTKEFTETFKNGLNVNASVEEIEKLTNRVKELEDELAKIKTPITLPSEESNTLSGSSQVKISDNITDQIIKNEKKKQDAYKATTEMVMYHAGIISKLNKAETNGQFYGSDRNTGYFGTGHYFVDANTKHELDDNDYYSSLPYTSIDISKYDNLFKATTDEIANALHTFLKNLTQFTQGSDLFDISELFSQFQKVFGESTMDMQEFDEKLSYLKTYMQNSDMFDRGDSVSTQFMKSLGYGGVDTRGTNYADTRYGTVIYDLKEESILQSNITDELQKQGQMLEKINYEKGQVFDSSEDNRIQEILNKQTKQKDLEAEFNNLFDSTNLDEYETELDNINEKLKSNENIISNCKVAIKNAEIEAKEMFNDISEFSENSVSDEQIKSMAIAIRENNQETIDEFQKEQEVFKKRKKELEANIEAENKLKNIAIERATTIVEERYKSNISLGDASTTSAEKFQQITNDTINVLSDVGKTEDQIVQKIQKERAEAEANNEVLREHLVLLDKAGKVVANHWGSTSNVNGTYTDEQLSQAQGGKIIHAHPGKASFFGGKDLQHLFQDSIYDQIKQIELIWGDSTLSVDKSTLTKQSSSTILNIMRNVRKALTEAYGDNQDGVPSREAREHINAIEKEIFKSIAQKLNVSVTEDGSMAKEVTDSLSDVDKAIIKRFSEIKASIIQDVDASSIIKSTMKDAFPDSSTNTKPETEGMEQVEKATEEAVQAKKDFATANEGVQSSIDGSENPLKLEAELMEQIARSAREAADAKKEFVKANKQVKDSANKSNNDLVDGHSENAEPSGVKKYKKKGYKAHDTGNHDNEKKVSNKAELEQALRELQSEIIASIDESTSFVKEITDFYDSQNDLVKTQTKVGDKNGGVRTYTHSYSTDKEGNTTAWTSHINSKKYQDQNKIIQEQIKNLQKLSAEKQKAAESERKSTVNQASKDQLEAWKQIQRIRKEIANTSNAKLVDQLEQEKKTYQEQFLTATKILKNNSDLYNSEQRLNELKKISLKTTQQIESTQQRQLNGYDNKLSGYQGKISGYKATIDKFGDDGWTSPEYSDNVQRAQQALKAYEDEVNKLKANPDLINKESLANVEKLGKDFEEATLAIKNMTAAQKGYTQLGAEKAMDKISQMLKENSKMSRQAKADIKAWYDQIKSGNPSASLDVILGKVEEIVRKEKEAGRGGKSMWDAIKEKAFYSAASVVGTYFGLNDIIRYGKEGIDIVRELDAAMTEVRKVSNATEGQYKSFRNTISSTAKEIATTNKELLNSSADFLRLGYSLDQASDLAKNATLFVNVGDGVDITEATEDMITAMKAFDIQAEDSIKIVDDYNQIGKYILPKHIVIYGDFLILESSYNG